MDHSIWTQTVSLPQFPALSRDIQTDVLVIGGGIAGLLCAHALTQAGVDTVVLEAARICGGVTQNTTAKITAQHGLLYHKLIRRFDKQTAGLYLEANVRALERYRSLCRDIDCDFEERDSYVYSCEDARALDRELRALHEIGYPARLVKTPELPFATAGAVCFPRQAQFHPLKFLSAVSRGLSIFEFSKVRELRGNVAVTENGSVSARHIIIATHFPILNKHGAYFLKMYQNRSYVLTLDSAPVPADGMYLGADAGGLSFRSFGDKLLLGGGAHRTGKKSVGWAEQEAFVSRYYPKARILSRTATQDCMTLDGIPYIGAYASSTNGLWVATGFQKWGMTTSMVAAELLKDRIIGRENPYARIFDPSRSMLRPQLAVNSVESILHLLTLGKPRCPHLGCALSWNPHEHSWDCACHGSRFTADGQLINNPSTADLRQ